MLIDGTKSLSKWTKTRNKKSVTVIFRVYQGIILIYTFL